jgi:hypothetical protein
VGAEEVRDDRDGVHHRGCHRVAVLGVADGVAEDVPQRHGAVVAQQREPGADRAGHGRREQPGAGHEVQAQVPEPPRGRGLGRHALSAQDTRGRVGRGHEDRGHLAARPVHVRLGHVQRERRRRGRVEGVATTFEDRHAR